jgi:hypothetical protein
MRGHDEKTCLFRILCDKLFDGKTKQGFDYSKLKKIMNEKNEIIEEIRHARKEIENENDGDLEKIFLSYKSRQDKNPQEYFTGKPVKIQKLKAA